MSQTYRIGTLNFTGSQAILSASLDVSGSIRNNSLFSIGQSGGTLVSNVNNTLTANFSNTQMTMGPNSIQFDANTTGEITFSTASTGSRLIIKNNGNIGIGNPSPSASLDVSGSGRFTSGLTVSGSGNALDVSGSGRFTDGLSVTGSINVLTGSVIINTSGSDNISLAAGRNMLRVYNFWGDGVWIGNGIDSTRLKLLAGPVQSSQIWFEANGAYAGAIGTGTGTGADAGALFVNPTNRFQVSLSNDEKIRVVSGSTGARMIVNITSSFDDNTTNFQVSGSGRFTNGLSVTGSITCTSDIAFAASGQRMEGNAGVGNWTFRNSGGQGWYFEWLQNGSTAMLLSRDNNLLLGTTDTSSLYRMEIARNLQGSGSLKVDTTLYVTGSSVGINTPTPLASLDVSGSGRFTNGLTVTGSIAVTGSSFTFNGATVPRPYKVYTAYVDMATGTALSVFENTLGVTITWTASSGQITTGTVIGLIGQNNVYVQVTSNTPSSSPKIVSGAFTATPWNVTIRQIDDTGTPDSTQKVYVEIRVYS